MTSNVSILKNGNISTILEWGSVEEPASRGYFVEAFGRGDALIDMIGKALLRHIYKNDGSQNPPDQTQKTRIIPLNGSRVFEMLENKGVIDKGMLSQIQNFKRVRNKVLHSSRGQYELLNPADAKSIQDEAAFDAYIEMESLVHLRDGCRIFHSLIDVFRTLALKNS